MYDVLLAEDLMRTRLHLAVFRREQEEKKKKKRRNRGRKEAAATARPLKIEGKYAKWAKKNSKPYLPSDSESTG